MFTFVLDGQTPVKLDSCYVRNHVDFTLIVLIDSWCVDGAKAWLLLCKKSCRFRLDWQLMCRHGEAEKLTTSYESFYAHFRLDLKKKGSVQMQARNYFSCSRNYSFIGFRRMSGGKPPWTPINETWWFILVNWFRYCTFPPADFSWTTHPVVHDTKVRQREGKGKAVWRGDRLCHNQPFRVV